MMHDVTQRSNQLANYASYVPRTMNDTEVERIPLLEEPPSSPASSDPLEARLQHVLHELEEHQRLRHQLALPRRASQLQGNDAQTSNELHRRNLEQLLQHEFNQRLYACVQSASEVVHNRDTGMAYLREYSVLWAICI